MRLTEVEKFSEDPMPGGTRVHVHCLPLLPAQRWVVHPSAPVRLGCSPAARMKGRQLQKRRCARLGLKQN